MKRNHYIYGNYVNGKLFYIGYSCTLNYKRAKDKHYDNERWMDKIKDSQWTYSIITENLSIVEARHLEEHLVDLYGREGIDEGGILTNKDRGGLGISENKIKYSEEELIKHRKEYYIKNREKQIDYQKQWYKENIDKVLKYRNRKEYINYHKKYDRLYSMKEIRFNYKKEYQKTEKSKQYQKGYREKKNLEKGKMTRIKLSEEQKIKNKKEKQRELREQGYYNTPDKKEYQKKYQKEYREKKKLEKLNLFNK